MKSVSSGDVLLPSVRYGIAIAAIVWKTGKECSVGAGAVA